MEIPDGNFRHILLYYCRKGKNAVQARKKLYDVYGEKSLTERQCQNWFARFRSGDFHLKDPPRSGCPTEADDDKIKAVIENNRRSATREIADKLSISHNRTCIEWHSKQLGYVKGVVYHRAWISGVFLTMDCEKTTHDIDTKFFLFN